jgi:hypothetical protein
MKFCFCLINNFIFSFARREMRGGMVVVYRTDSEKENTNTNV